MIILYRESLWLFLDDDKWNLTMIGGGTSGNMAISVECQFLLTLSILRRDFDYLEAAQIFGLEAKTSVSNQAYKIVSKIFKTWLIFIYRKFRLVLNAYLLYIEVCESKWLTEVKVWERGSVHFLFSSDKVLYQYVSNSLLAS